MISEIQVKNFALVDDGVIAFHNGFNVVTGETGAGKSLLLAAISLLLGSKASNSVVRDGAATAEVQGCFVLAGLEEYIDRALRMGFEIDPDDGATLIVRRELGVDSSRNRIWIQGKLATRRELQELLGDLVEISGQHEFLKLTRPDCVLGFLDRYAGLAKELEAYRKQFRYHQQKNQELSAALTQEKSKAERIDYLKFAVEEFEKYGVSEHFIADETRFLADLQRLVNADKIRHAFEEINSAVCGEDHDFTVALKKVSKTIDHLVHLAPDFQSLRDSFFNAHSAFSDWLFELERRSSGMTFSPESKDELEAQVSHWSRLKRKFSCDSVGLQERYVQFREELERVENSADHLDQLKQEVDQLGLELDRKALELHRQRISISSKLHKDLKKELSPLGLPHAALEFELTSIEDRNINGRSQVRLMFSANPGVAAQPISEVASGGELSRVTLALKSVVHAEHEVGVFLFDEIDAGIGGETGLRVGERLAKLARRNQVLCVTHLAQVASFAGTHFIVVKHQDKKSTRTRISEVQGAARVAEVARMLGNMSSSAANRLAKELLEESRPLGSAGVSTKSRNRSALELS